MSETQVTCTRCNQTFLEWKFDENQNKNRLWEISKRIWHVCIEIPTTVHPKKIFWYCFVCGNIDINNHPCLHFQQLDPGTRSMIKMNPGKKL